MDERELYEDFKLTLENCDVEPIHRPVAISSHGCLFCFRENDSKHLYACSENVLSLLGIASDKLFDMDVEDWMDPVLLKVHKEMDNKDEWDSIDPVPANFLGKEYNIIRHIHGGYRFIEIEDKKSSIEMPHSIFHTIRLVTEPMARISSLPKLFDHLVKQLKKCFLYDRVMIYKFDQDYHGFVAAEEKESHLESFLGLHYPATDIPKMARDLFLINKSRIIPEVSAQKSWLQFNPALKKASHLDLSLTQLRGTSPVHIEYLKNMGVEASFTLAIVVENRLWGLIASHHYSSKFLSYEMRKTAELIVSIFSQRVNEIIQKQITSIDRLYRSREKELLDYIDLSSDTATQLINQEIDFGEICEAHGCAVVSNVGSYHIGSVPSQETLNKLWGHVIQSDNQLFVSNNLSDDLSKEIDIPKQIGGLLAINLHIVDNMVIMWFKNSKVYEYNWAGDPSRPYEVDYLANQEVRISPRKSFEKWKTRVTTQSDPWGENELRMAQRIRKEILKKDAEREALKSKMMRDAMEQLTYVTSHDLQEPLRTVTNYLELISQGLKEGEEKEEYMRYINRTTLAASRMKRLVVDLLDYSRASSKSDETKNWINISEIIQQIQLDFALAIEENNVVFNMGDLPAVYAVETELKQVFQNIILNAIKYRKKKVDPFIKIQSSREGEFQLFSISDNGIGIKEKYYDKVFMLFQRLHSKEEYEGTGIGLAQCKKIIENMGGNIWLSSQEGIGSTFHFNIHQSLVKDSN